MSTAADRALRILEQRALGQLATALSTVVSDFGAALAAAQRAAPAHTSATEILSRTDVHQALTAALATAQATAEATVRAAYTAAAQLARLSTAAELRGLGHDVPTDLPTLGDQRDTVLRDLRTAFGAAQLDIHDRVRAAHDGVTGSAAPAARVLTSHAAVQQVARRLAVRVNAAASYAVHRGYTDTQLAVYDAYTAVNPYVAIGKTWQTSGTDPCPQCAALHATTVAIDAEFDHKAGAEPTATHKAVYRDLLGPPRHPHCRCRLTFDLIERVNRP